MKKILLGLSLILINVFAHAQTQGLENIIVEKYYISNQQDSIGASGFGDELPVGSTTYRIFVDMLPGYKFQAAYGTQDNTGTPLHTLMITTSTSFYNNTDRGHEIPSFSKANAAQHTTMLDSYFSCGAACANGAGPTYNYGILKADDGSAGGTNVTNANGILQNNDPNAGIPLTTADGIYGVSSPAVSSVTFVNMAGAQSDFDAGPSSSSFITSNASWASLAGATGPTSANRVLIGQFTTNGCFHFELNIQIGTPTGGVQKYVAKNATGSEILFPACIYPPAATNTPTVSIAPSPVVPLCAGSTVTLAATTTNGGASPSYQWQKNGINVGTNTTSYSTTLAANDTIVCVLTTSILCPNENPVNSNAIIVNPPPAVAFQLAGSFNVDAASVTLTGSPAGGTFSGTGISGNTFSPAAAGVGGPYTITYSYTDAGGCSNSVTHQTTVLDAHTGPSTSASPYIIPVPSGPGVKITSMLTTQNVIGGYEMEGTPDGLGAYDNGNGTFTLLMNHEFLTSQGCVRAHGSIGSLVSKWIINSSTLAVQSGSDLIQNINLWNTNTSTYTTYNSGNPSILARLGRLCSADLPAVSAFYNAGTGMGTQERIFMNGEETNDTSRAFAHIVTGANAGTSWELPAEGKASWENAVANPTEQNKTIVALDNDGTDGQVYMYIGTKTNTGTEIQKAGLTNGHPWGVKVTGFPVERVNSTTINNPPSPGTHFDLVDLGDVTNVGGVAFNTNSNTAGVTKFSRPEDGAWDPNHPEDYYFNTTDQLDQVNDGIGTQVGRTRVWKLHFTDIYNPESGGTIEAVLDGTEGINMLDNMTIDHYGHILLNEDVGNAAHNGKVWQYTIATDALKMIAKHDPNRFGDIGVPATSPFNVDEETSGILDVQDILGAGMFLNVVQAHYLISGCPVEGGQLQEIYNPDTYNSSLCATSSTTSISSCVSYTWNGHTYTNSGTFTFHTPNSTGCDSTATLVLTINPLPTGVTAGNVSGCAGSAIALSGSPAGGTFSVANPYTGPSATYTYTYTNANGCSATSAPATITVNPLPTVTASNVSGCAGSAIALSGSPAGGTFSVTNPYTGPSTTYTYSYTDGNGCSNTSAPATITVNPLPTVTASNVSGCAGSAIALSGSPAGGTFSVANPYTGPSTTYTYSYTDGNGCSNTSASATITVNPLPTVSAGNVSGCAGSAIALSGSPAGGTFSVANPYTGPSTTYTYSYTDGNGCSNTSASATITVNPLPTVSAGNVSGCEGTAIALSGSPAGGTFSVANPYTGPSTTYTYSYTDGNGCSNTSASATITVNPLPTVTAGNVSGCAGSAIALSGSPAGGTFSVANPYTGPSTTYTYSYTDGNGCSNTSASATITVNPLPTVTAGNVSGCAGSAIALSGSPAGGTFSKPNPYTGPSTTYTYSYTDGNGCSNTSAPANITVNPLPTVSFTGLASTYNVSAPPATLTGTPSGGTFSGPGISGNTFTPSVAGVGGPYTITYSYSDGNGCGNSVNHQTVVSNCTLPAQPSVISTLGGVPKVCPGSSRTYYVNVVSGATSYTWTTPAGGNITSGLGTRQITVSYDAGFTSSGTLSVVANNTCGSGLARTLVINPDNPPQPGVITGQTFGVCNSVGVPYSITNVGLTYNWSFNVGTASIASGQGSSSVTADFSGAFTTGQIIVTASNACGTSPQRVLAIKAIPATTTGITGATSVCAHQAGVPYSTAPILTATEYTWTGPTGCRISDGVTTSTSNKLITTATSVTIKFGVSSGPLYVKGANTCGYGVNDGISIAITCRTENEENQMDVNVYPNPASTQLNVEVSENATMQLMDASGRQVVLQTNVYAGQKQEINTQNLANGIYMMKIFNDNFVSIKKVVINK